MEDVRDESEPETSSETDAIAEAREREQAALKQKQAAYANGLQTPATCGDMNGGCGDGVNGSLTAVANGASANGTSGKGKVNGFSAPTHSNSC